MLVDGVRGEEKSVDTGVPQGSPVSSLLFLLYTTPPELDLKILLDTKKGLDAVVKFLDSLPQLLC